ncbi:uncharacterized protein LOC134697725 [Mytilus trossulus]|uniref:uncharacterized protein LOC134697725 n=1 Tax=Mytilus trossulus TaxID=6551 RepID=UPI0030077B82
MSLFLVTVVFFFSFVSGKDRPGECFKYDWNKALQTNERVNYCCDDYENRNGTCIECGKGYTSTDGSQCQQCHTQTFGKKCLQSCQCTENQRCHHIEGCVNYQQSTTSQMTTEGMLEILLFFLLLQFLFNHFTSVTLMTKMYDGETERDGGMKEDDNDQNNCNEYNT